MYNLIKTLNIWRISNAEADRCSSIDFAITYINLITNVCDLLLLGEENKKNKSIYKNELKCYYTIRSLSFERVYFL
jgi:hypothetical protein